MSKDVILTKSINFNLSILQRMRERKICLPIFIVSGEEDIWIIKSALVSGTRGFILKSHNSQQMLSALQVMLDGEIYIPTYIEKQINKLETGCLSADSRLSQRF